MQGRIVEYLFLDLFLDFIYSSRTWGRNECVTNEPQRTSAGRLNFSRLYEVLSCNAQLIILMLSCAQ